MIHFSGFQKMFWQPHFLPLSGHDSTFPDQIYNGKHVVIVMLVVYPDRGRNVDTKNGQPCPERPRELGDTAVQSSLGLSPQNHLEKQPCRFNSTISSSEVRSLEISQNCVELLLNFVLNFWVLLNFCWTFEFCWTFIELVLNLFHFCWTRSGSCFPL